MLDVLVLISHKHVAIGFQLFLVMSFIKVPYVIVHSTIVHVEFLVVSNFIILFKISIEISLILIYLIISQMQLRMENIYMRLTPVRMIELINQW